MDKKITLVIFLILILGVIFRLIITSNGYFIFNMDNARDMVDVREMVVLGKLRLIGQTTAVEGLFYGPFWYYLLAIPFIISGGDPFASIIMEIFLWAFGGYFLMWLVKKYYGILPMLATGFIWVASNFLILGIQYAFNPNPVLFLTPVFIYLLIKTIDSQKISFSLLTWFMAGLFFHFEITVGLFMPLVIIMSFLLTKKYMYFKSGSFFAGILAFTLTFAPQLLFELRHQFFLTKSLLSYQSGSHSQVKVSSLVRVLAVGRSFYDTFLATMMNFNQFTSSIIVLLIPSLIFARENLIKNRLTLVAMLVTLIPVLGLIPLKVDLMRWHLNASLVGGVILVGFVVNTLYSLKWLWGKAIAVGLFLVLTIYCLNNVWVYVDEWRKNDLRNSHFQAEVDVVDYIYKEAKGKNFKVYTYMPSVIDYPYQYLFWWRGLKQYGYLPEDYAYLPSVPEYIKYKNNLNIGSNPASSGLVYLVKEPDQIGQRHLWENSFQKYHLIKTAQVGPLIIETRQDITH